MSSILGYVCYIYIGIKLHPFTLQLNYCVIRNIYDS